MKTILLKITNSEIQFNENDSISIGNTSLPYTRMRFRTEYKDIYWEVELCNVDVKKRELRINVIDYNPINYEAFSSQKFEYPFFRINFELLDWIQVAKQLQYYQESAIKAHFFGIGNEEDNRQAEKAWADPGLFQNNHKKGDAKSESPELEAPFAYPTRNRIEEELIINFKDFHFNDGFVSTLRRLKYPDLELNIVIYNPVFKKQFEYIKEYFIQYLGRKTVRVFIDFNHDYRLDEIINLRCKCSDLEKIDESVIESIKIKRTNRLKKPIQKVTQPILDLEELFQYINDVSTGINVFNQSEKDILNHFIIVEGKKHKQHLSFLADKLYQSNEKVRFTIHPIFGFVFSYQKKSNFYLIWELLDSHATYVWYVENGKMTEHFLYSEFEKAIEYIIGLGRENYKKAYREAIINTDVNFASISHVGSDESGFINWKDNLLAIIH